MRYVQIWQAMCNQMQMDKMGKTLCHSLTQVFIFATMADRLVSSDDNSETDSLNASTKGTAVTQWSRCLAPKLQFAGTRLRRLDGRYIDVRR